MPTFSMFPKFLRDLPAARLAEVVCEVGLDTVNLVVRDGYWVSRANLAQDLPRFLAIMKTAGLRVTFATACFEIDEILADDRPLAILAEHGLERWRCGYLRAEGHDVRGSLERGRQRLAALAALGAQRGIQAVYQLHHGTLLPSPSSIWPLVQDLDPRWLGVEPDVGNQGFEGWEDWQRTADLLGSHLCALGVKDTRIDHDPGAATRPSKGWRRSWAPCHQGMADWHAIFRALRSIGFDGVLALQPFYHEHDTARHLADLRTEVAWLRGVWNEVEDSP